MGHTYVHHMAAGHCVPLVVWAITLMGQHIEATLLFIMAQGHIMAYSTGRRPVHKALWAVDLLFLNEMQ